MPKRSYSSQSDPRMQLPHPMLDQWVQAVNAHDIEALCSLYAPDAVLMPTLSRTIRNSPETIRDYFEMFLGLEALHASLDVCCMQAYEGVKIDSGVYTFSFMEDGAERVFQARFAFAFREGLIRMHHSSLMPASR